TRTAICCWWPGCSLMPPARGPPASAPTSAPTPQHHPSRSTPVPALRQLPPLPPLPPHRASYPPATSPPPGPAPPPVLVLVPVPVSIGAWSSTDARPCHPDRHR